MASHPTDNDIRIAVYRRFVDTGIWEIPPWRHRP
jgi:hypothetical protein